MMSHTFPQDLFPIEIPTPFPVGPVNVFLWKGEPLTLIDTGPRTDDAYAALTAGLRAHRLLVSDIERVLLTHHHVDHAGLLRRIVEESRAVTYAHPEVPSENRPENRVDPSAWDAYFSDMLHELGVPAPEVRGVTAFMASFRNLSEPYHIDHAYEDCGEVAPFTAYFVPGHSVTDTLLVSHRGRCTATGDHLLENINPNPLIHRPARPDAPRIKSLVAYQRSLHRSRQLELGLCFPGHGEPFRDYRRVIDAALAKHARRERRVLRLMGSGGITPYALARKLYPEAPLENLYLVLSVALGHLEVLEEKQQAGREHHGGTLVFRTLDRDAAIEGGLGT